jgi:adenosine kinase
MIKIFSFFSVNEVINNPTLKHILGGSVQNTLRAIQWLSNNEPISAFTGSIGDDNIGKEIHKIMEELGILCFYSIISGKSSGKCVVLVNNDNRCMIADLGASKLYSASFLFSVQLEQVIQNAKLIYAEGFFVEVSMESLLTLAHRCLVSTDSKFFVFNLSGVYIIDRYFKFILELLPYVSYLFCNDSEARAFAAQMNLKEKNDIKKIVCDMVLFPAFFTGFHRVVIITCGKNDVIMGKYNKSQVEINSFPVTEIPQEEFVDSDGCGDSCVGGFLCKLLKGEDVSECVKEGIRVAQICARNEGCTFSVKKS